MVFQTVQIFNESEGYFNPLDCLKWKNAFFKQTVTLRLIIGRFFIAFDNSKKSRYFVSVKPWAEKKVEKILKKRHSGGIYTAFLGFKIGFNSKLRHQE